MLLLKAVGILIFSSTVIYLVGQRFAKSSSRIGDFLGLPRDVKGATFDAISSSLPELLIGLFSVIFFQKFEVGIGTIAGSALFNLLVIPGICVFVTPVAFKVSRKVISRDALFYIIAIFSLIICLTYFKSWGLPIGFLLLTVYGLYLREIIMYTKTEQKKHSKHIQESETHTPTNISKEVLIFISLLFVIGGFTYLLTEASIDLAHILEIPPVIVAFTIVASATSVPDMVISISNAKKGDIDDATSNVFGSNIFDVLVGIGLPLIIYVLMKGEDLVIAFENLEIIFGLLGASIIVLYFFAQDSLLRPKQGKYLLSMYLIFILYVVYLGLK